MNWYCPTDLVLHHNLSLMTVAAGSTNTTSFPGPFPAPPPGQGKGPGNEVDTDNVSGVRALEESRKNNHQNQQGVR